MLFKDRQIKKIEAYNEQLELKMVEILAEQRQRHKSQYYQHKNMMKEAADYSKKKVLEEWGESADLQELKTLESELSQIATSHHNNPKKLTDKELRERAVAKLKEEGIEKPEFKIPFSVTHPTLHIVIVTLSLLFLSYVILPYLSKFIP